MPISNIHEGITINGLLPRVNVDDNDFFDVNNSKFLYARGFLCCKISGLKINSHFTEIPIGGGYFLYFHELIKPDIRSTPDGKLSVILMGTAYFTNKEYIEDSKSEVDILLEKLLCSEECFYKALDFLAGRYALICMTPEKTFAVNDPCGMRTIFYCSEPKCIGSHLELVNMTAQKGLSEMELHIREKGYRYNYAYPSNLTKYSNIVMLIPNFSLSLDTFEIKRYFPRDKINKTENVLNVRDKYFEVMRTSITELMKKGKRLCFSLTGGKDSKVSFYSTKEFKDSICYFTEARDDDIEKSKRVALENGLRWIGTDSKDLIMRDNAYNKAFYDILDKNIFPPTAKDSLRTQFWNYNLFGGNDDFIHINSNCAEAGRGRPGSEDIYMPFAGSSYNLDKFTDVYFKSTYRWQPRDVKERQSAMMKDDVFLNNVLSDYYTVLNHEALLPLGYNPWDFAYIEQRIAFLLSQQYMVSDSIYDSISLTNSREALMVMWQLPEIYTLNDSHVLYDCILNEFDPEFREKNMGKGFVSPQTPDKDTYHLIYAGYALTKGMDAEKRIELADKVIGLNKNVKWAHKVKIEGYLSLGNSSKAAEARDIVHSFDTEFAREFINCGDALCNGLRQLNKTHSARCLIDYVLQSNPEMSWAYKQLSHITFSEGKVWEALSLAETAFSLNSKDRWIAQNYIFLLLDAGQTEKAKSIISNAAEKDKEAFWPNYCFSLYYQKTNDYRKALEYCERALEINSTDNQALNRIKELKSSIK